MNERIHISGRTYLRMMLCAALLLLPLTLNAQLRSISTYTGYSSTFSKRLHVTNADAVGMGIDVVYSVAENVNIGIRGGYSLYSVNQTDQLNGWGWRFWNDRYLNKIQADMKADPSLSAVIGSVQKMDLIPVTLHGEYIFSVAEDFTVAPTLGIGAAFYQRRLYADETWTKTFPAADYSFTYNFRNFAPSKKGNPLFAVVGASAHYKMFSSVGMISSLLYTQYLDTPDRFGYNGFIFSNELTVRLGLEFFY